MEDNEKKGNSGLVTFLVAAMLFGLGGLVGRSCNTEIVDKGKERQAYIQGYKKGYREGEKAYSSETFILDGQPHRLYKENGKIVCENIWANRNFRK